MLVDEDIRCPRQVDLAERMPILGKEQLAVAVVRLSLIPWPLVLAPRLVNNDM